MDAMKNQTALDNYFIELKNILDENELQHKPGQIYNMDESGVPLDHRSPRVLARKGQKKVRYCSTGNKSQITVVGCITAIGQALPHSLYSMQKILTFSGPRVRFQVQLMD